MKYPSTSALSVSSNADDHAPNLYLIVPFTLDQVYYTSMEHFSSDYELTVGLSVAGIAVGVGAACCFVHWFAARGACGCDYACLAATILLRDEYSLWVTVDGIADKEKTLNK